MDVYYEGHICGDFEGFDEGKIFKLDDGSYWRQTEYEYEYDYEYEPPAQIIGEYGCFYLRVKGMKAAVEPIDVIAESQIDGEFTGWDDNKAYKLLNGDVWKQKSYHYEYKYAAYPVAIIIMRYGSYYMLVEGTECEVECVSGMSSFFQSAYNSPPSYSSYSSQENYRPTNSSSDSYDNSDTNDSDLKDQIRLKELEVEEQRNKQRLIKFVITFVVGALYVLGFVLLFVVPFMNDGFSSQLLIFACFYLTIGIFAFDSDKFKDRKNRSKR